MSNRSTLSNSEDEYVRLKLELAAKRASVDTVRLQARQLISKRDGVSIGMLKLCNVYFSVNLL